MWTSPVYILHITSILTNTQIFLKIIKIHTNDRCLTFTKLSPPNSLLESITAMQRVMRHHLCTYQCNSRWGGGGGAGKGQGFDAWDYPHVGLLIVWSDPGVGTFDFDRQKPGIPGINSEAVSKSVPWGFLKVTLLEKGMKFSFVLIAIIRYF